MKERCLQWLVCPDCRSPLEPDVYSREDREILEGTLNCPNGHLFPIIGGIPRMLLAPLSDSLPSTYPDFFQRHPGLMKSPGDPGRVDRKKEETMDRFGFEWSHFSDYSCDNFASFISPLPPGFFPGRLGLDVGCGAGRHAGQAAELGAEVLAIDLSRAVDSAFLNNRGSARVHVIQADVYQLPFREGLFQFVYSLGVLHHLPEPERGFQNLVPCLQEGGALFVWLYAHSSRKVTLEFLRFWSQRLSNANIRRMAFLCNLIDFGVFMNAYRLAASLPLLGAAAKRFAPPRVREYAGLGFRVAYTDWFDRLSAPITHYYREEEMRSWLEKSGLVRTGLLPVEDSWWWLYGERGRTAS